MTEEACTRFIEFLKETPSLAQELLDRLHEQDAAAAQAILVEFAGDHDLALDEQDAQTLMRQWTQDEGELSDDELERVAGGRLRVADSQLTDTTYDRLFQKSITRDEFGRYRTATHIDSWKGE